MNKEFYKYILDEIIELYEPGKDLLQILSSDKLITDIYTNLRDYYKIRVEEAKEEGQEDEVSLYSRYLILLEEDYKKLSQ